MDVVISGIGGYFPGSRNIKEFNEKLLAGKNLLKPTDRWVPGYLGTPPVQGETKDHDRFDQSFFGLLYDTAKYADPPMRRILESAFEALVDAGICPSTIRGTDAQVFTSSLLAENDLFSDDYGEIDISGYVIMGKSRAMTSNRLSYCLNLTGRSCAHHGTSAWLGQGLALARDAIMAGECDTVFVSGASMMALLEVNKQVQNMGLLSPDGSSRPFDIDVNGAGRSEAQVTFLVQRADIAKRSYGSIVLAHAETQSKLPNWFLSLNKEEFRNCLETLYRDNGIDPNNVKVLEADGMCLKDMIEPELNVLDEILNSNRPEGSPLLLGSVKSITGDPEAAAGHTALTKLMLALDTGVLAPTIDYNTPNPNIPGLTSGRFKVITEPTKLNVTADTHVAVSSLSIHGVISHVVLKANGKAKDPNVKNEYPLPYLVLMSGRTEEGVEKSLEEVAYSPFDPEYLRLVQEVFSISIDKFECRGYGFHGQDKSEKFVVQRDDRRPVCFVYSGMGSQWPGMGRELRLFPIVEETFQRLHKVLEPKGIDLLHILTTLDTHIFDNILHSFVGIAAVQVALTNLLAQLDIKFDCVIGHSVGELGCSYADGCLTEEQTVLAAYERGMASLKADLIPGLMAAVGLGYNEMEDLLPPDVYVACRNSTESCTISGPTESVNKVIESLEEKKIFVRGVNVSNIAYHSPYIKPAAPFLYQSLRKVIPKPKLRSSKWICTSAPTEKWDSDEVRYCSAEYHTNNLLGPVLFEEGSAYVPKNAIVIEIAPHGLLQAIIKRSFGSDKVHAPLTKRAASSPAKFLLQAIGKLFVEGLSPKIWRLYPNVEMPVSRNTPSLVPLLKWIHSEKFNLPKLYFSDCMSRERMVRELIHPCPWEEVLGIKTLPAASALMMARGTCVDFKRLILDDTIVIFDDLRFYDLIRFEENSTAKVVVNMAPMSEHFEITRNDVSVIVGRIRVAGKNDFEPVELPKIDDEPEYTLNSDDVYSELKSRGIDVPNDMQQIEKVDIYPHDWIAGVTFHGEWTSLLNALFTLLQLKMGESKQGPSYISYIRRMIIDPSQKNTKQTSAQLHIPSSTIVCQGISVNGIEFQPVEKRAENAQPASLQFVPFQHTGLKNEEQFLSIILHLCSEKRVHLSPTIKIYDVGGRNVSLVKTIQDVSKRILNKECEVTNDLKDANLIVCGPSSIDAMAPILVSSNSLLITENYESGMKISNETLSDIGLCIVADGGGPVKSLVAITSMLPQVQPKDCQIIKMKPQERVPTTLKDSAHKLIVLVWENGTCLPIEKMLKDVSVTGLKEKVRFVFLMTPNAPPFSMSCPLFADQIRVNVPVHIYLDGKWGNYRIMQLPAISIPDQDECRELAIRQGTALVDGNKNTFKLNYTDMKVHRFCNDEEKSVEAVAYCCEDAKTLQRIMGIAIKDGHSEYLEADPQLFWAVPEKWELDEAANVPYSYAMSEAIHIIVCPSDFFVFMLKRRFPKGVNVIVSDLAGSKLKSSLPGLRAYGRFVQVDNVASVNRESIGLFFFDKNTFLFGVSPQSLVNASAERKKDIRTWTQYGLDSGVIAPHTTSHKYLSKGIPISGVDKWQLSGRGVHKTTNGRHIQEEDCVSTLLSKSLPKDKSCSLIIGGSKAQWVRLAHCLACKGSKKIALIQENPSPHLAVRHARILQEEFGTQLKDMTSFNSAADLLKTGLDTIESVYIFEQNRFAEDLVRELHARRLKNIQITFFSKSSTHFSRMCEPWARNGFNVRAAVGVEDASNDKCIPLLDWIQSSAAPPVSIVDKTVFLKDDNVMVSLVEAGLIPSSVAELQALGSAVRGMTSPTFKELCTRGRSVEMRLEVEPLFFIKGIHGTATSELATLAQEMLSPVIEVTVPEKCGTVKATALAIIKGMQGIQSTGPYNIAGDTIRSGAIVEIARILEERGFASVIFLMDEDFKGIREWVTLNDKINRLGVNLIKSSLFGSLGGQAWMNELWDSLSWKQQVKVATSRISSLNGEQLNDVITALHHVRDSVLQIIEAEEDISLNHGIVHFIRKGEEFSDNFMNDRLYHHTVPSSELKEKRIAHKVISPNLGTPSLQLAVASAQKSKRR